LTLLFTNTVCKQGLVHDDSVRDDALLPLRPLARVMTLTTGCYLWKYDSRLPACNSCRSLHSCRRKCQTAWLFKRTTRFFYVKPTMSWTKHNYIIHQLKHLLPVTTWQNIVILCECVCAPACVQSSPPWSVFQHYLMMWWAYNVTQPILSNECQICSGSV